MSKGNFPKNVAIPLTTAEVWTKKYRKETNDNEVFKSNNKKVNSFLIPRESLELVLQLNTSAVRAYVGLNDDNHKTLLFVGAEEDESGVYRDVFGTNREASLAESSTAVVYDFVQPSPPHTPDDRSPLNN
ncbi:MAG: hypothetical protein ACRC6O_03240 [Flavobacterium sp.]